MKISLFLIKSDASGSDVHGPLCGNDLPEAITLSSNEAILTFRSDEVVTRAGFEVKWEVSH